MPEQSLFLSLIIPDNLQKEKGNRPVPPARSPLRSRFFRFREEESIMASQSVLFGLGDWFVFAAMVGSALITVVCVIFGIINWNSGTGEEKK